MAFVNEEPRKFNFNSEREINDVGPGHYLPITENKQFKQNPAPFESSSLKLSTKGKNYPGPGSYNIDKGFSKGYSKLKTEEKVLLIKKLDSLPHKQSHSNDYSTDIEYRQASIKVRYNYERLGFSIREKRFKVNPKKLVPEAELKHHKCSIDNPKKSKPSNNIIKGQLSGYINNIPSIPQKGSCGFIIKDANHYVQRNNPDQFIYFSGVNGDTVGPGSYNIDIPDEWRRTGTNWAKMKVPRLKTAVDHSSGAVHNESLANSNRSNILDYININDPQQKPQKSAVNISNIALKQLIKHKLDMKAKQNISIRKSSSYNIIHSGPGPGHYYNVNLHSAFKQINPYEGGIIFGSKKERFNKSLFDFNNDDCFYSPGPASYFNNTKRELNSITTRRKQAKEKSVQPFYSNSSRFNSTTKSSSSLPGPGTYDSQSSMTSKNFSKTSTAFYAHQKRFIETIQEMENKKKIPGPGAYLNPFPMMSRRANSFESNNNSDKCISSRRNQEQSRRQPDSNAFRSVIAKRDLGASVGQYNADYSSSIEYNNIKKCYNNKREVAFNSNCPRDKNQLAQQNGIIGPGSYFNDSFIDFHQRLVPFNYSTSRMTILKPSKSEFNTIDQNSNDDYNNNSVSPWKKRTYNIKYL